MVRRLYLLHKGSRRVYSIAHGGSVFNFAFTGGVEGGGGAFWHCRGLTEKVRCHLISRLAPTAFPRGKAYGARQNAAPAQKSLPLEGKVPNGCEADDVGRESLLQFCRSAKATPHTAPQLNCSAEKCRGKSPPHHHNLII